MTELTSLWLPILASTAALFFLGFLTWMVLPVHQPDWKRLPDEDAVSDAIRGLNIPAGNYMIPYCGNSEEMKSEAFLERQKQGPNGILQIWYECGMGKALGMQVLFLLGTVFCIAYLASLALQPGATFMNVFQFVGAAAMITFTAGHIPERIWFKRRVMGNVIDGVLYGIATGLIFAALWPGVVT
ncbi:hypothetical protein [Adhaeretor mobilis]|uniref:Uncharacterized protein n=1 Tax=Adhaeretor mobilis TaxID=1930276 RepID=A0A517MPF1_9BACT|nr:hypothetical protein [Adhaeretor mobilis]QDS96749.1 hypothetical protein HG15A2_00070 [Adhaeretor mobilis]